MILSKDVWSRFHFKTIGLIWLWRRIRNEGFPFHYLLPWQGSQQSSCYIMLHLYLDVPGLGFELWFAFFLRLTKHVPAIAFHCFANSLFHCCYSKRQNFHGGISVRTRLKSGTKIKKNMRPTGTLTIKMFDINLTSMNISHVGHPRGCCTFNCSVSACFWARACRMMNAATSHWSTLNTYITESGESVDLPLLNLSFEFRSLDIMFNNNQQQQQPQQQPQRQRQQQQQV